MVLSLATIIIAWLSSVLKGDASQANWPLSSLRWPQNKRYSTKDRKPSASHPSADPFVSITCQTTYTLPAGNLLSVLKSGEKDET